MTQDTTQIEILTSDNIKDMLSLQDTVIAFLKRYEQEHFIIERERAYFLRHVQSPSTIIGIRSDEGALIAQGIFHHSERLNPDYIDGITLDSWKLCDKVSTLQGVLVHPDFQGKGLMRTLIDFWMSWAQENGYEHLLTRAEEHNTRSIHSFTKAGMLDVGTIIDARDNATVKVLHKRILHDG